MQRKVGIMYQNVPFCLFRVDGALIRCTTQTKTRKSKNHRRGINVRIVARAEDRRVVAVTEHVIARMKDYPIRRQCRKENTIDYATAGVAVLHNLESP